MDNITLYDNEGDPIAYIDNEQGYETIYLFNGRPVAWIFEDCIYTYSGQHLGWIKDGWILNHNGEIVFFTQDAKGGTYLPAKQPLPARDEKWAVPDRGARSSCPFPPYPLGTWSALSTEKIFMPTTA